MEKGCKICEKYKEHYYREHVNGKGVEFYELMHGDFSQHLRMPKKFAHYFGGELPETVDLKGHSGKIWPVGLKETNDEIVMQSGWKEFVEAHHIQEEDLLVFKYDGNYRFDISIFDENHCKKEACYLFMDSNTEKQERSEDSVEVLNVKSCRNVVVCSPPGSPRDDMLHASPFSTTRKISRENERPASKYQKAESSCKRRICWSNEISGHPKNKQCNPCPDIGAQGTRYNIKEESVDIHNLDKLAHPNLYMPGRKRLTSEEEKRASLLFHSVQPSNPCFISILQSHNVYDACYIYVPIRFQKAHLPSESCTISLQVPGRRKKWWYHLSVYSTMTRFCWESFVIDNGLQVGDACLFELINNLNDIVMTVSIHRTAGQDVTRIKK